MLEWTPVTSDLEFENGADESWEEMEVCRNCFFMGRPHLFPQGSLKVYEWWDPFEERDGSHVHGHQIEMLCEDCAVVHWAQEVKGA